MVGKNTPQIIMGMKSSANAIIIHPTKLGPSLVPKLIMECNNADHWHRFMILNVEQYQRDFILRTIMDFVYPADLIALNFVKKKRAFFLARNCLDALLKLTRNKLEIPNPLNPLIPFKVIVVANHCPAHQLKFDFEENVKSILRKRFNRKTKHLTLMRFHTDRDLKEFFPLSQPNLMMYVIQFVVELRPETLDLRYNVIKVLDPLRLLAGCKITTIDLSHNKIAHMEDLEPLRDLKELKFLSLNMNPLCNKWDAVNYMYKIKDICCNLETLDDVTVNKKELRDVRKNFLCSNAGGDLTSQFIEHFFTVYDSEDRQNLAPLYHKDATFSVTTRIIPKQNSDETAQLKHYQAIDRNLLCFQCFKDPSHKFLFTGREVIMELFASLPRSDHLPYVFTCDLMYFREPLAILVVTGCFRENKSYISFSRTFVLKKDDDDDTYTIINDQLHVHNMLNPHIKKADGPNNVEFSGRPLPYHYPEYIKLENAVHDMTNLNSDYSQRFLVECHYDLKSTLELFIDMHLKDEIPPEAFIQVDNEERPQVIGRNQACVPCPKSLERECVLKYRSVTPKTIWQTVKDKRLAAECLQKDATPEIQDLDREKRKNNILLTPYDAFVDSRFTLEENINQKTFTPQTSEVVDLTQNGVKNPQGVRDSYVQINIVTPTHLHQTGDDAQRMVIQLPQQNLSSSTNSEGVTPVGVKLNPYEKINSEVLAYSNQIESHHEAQTKDVEMPQGNILSSTNSEACHTVTNDQPQTSTLSHKAYQQLAAEVANKVFASPRSTWDDEMLKKIQLLRPPNFSIHRRCRVKFVTPEGWFRWLTIPGVPNIEAVLPEEEATPYPHHHQMENSF